MSGRARRIAALLAVLACACGAPPVSPAPQRPPGEAPGPEPGWHVAVSAAGTWRVRWRCEPDPLQTHALGRILVEAERADGARPDELRADAGMPEHDHGLVRRTRVESLGDGRFAVEDLYLHMPGAWRVYLDLGREGLFERLELELELD